MVANEIGLAHDCQARPKTRRSANVKLRPIFFTILVGAWASAVAQVPPETITAAIAAMADADRQVVEGPALVDGVKVSPARNLPSPGLWVDEPPQGFRIGGRVQFGVVANMTVSPMGGGPGDGDRLIAVLQTLAAPYQEACQRIGGGLKTFEVDMAAPKDPLALRAAYDRGRHDHLLGQHQCLVDGQPVAAFVVTVLPVAESTLLPPGWKLEARVMSLMTKDVARMISAAHADVAEFGRLTDELRANGKPGTEVQVRADALQVAGRVANTNWVCALLIDRRDALMQVQVGMATVFVPATSVVPRVTFKSQKPGLPGECSMMAR
jgi:hypothetical protein